MRASSACMPYRVASCPAATPHIMEASHQREQQRLSLQRTQHLWEKQMSASVDSLLESLSMDTCGGNEDYSGVGRPSSASSGIGSLGSFRTTCSSESSRSSSPLGHSTPSPVAPPRVMFRGRDLLDLGANLLDSRWHLQPTVLPPRNLKMYWENRSQYHRLSEQGTRELLKQEMCTFPNCNFKTPLPGSEYF